MKDEVLKVLSELLTLKDIEGIKERIIANELFCPINTIPDQKEYWSDYYDKELVNNRILFPPPPNQHNHKTK